MRKTICIALMILSVAASFGQSIETANLRWNVNGVYDKASNQDISLTSRFETGPELIQWIQKGGALTYNFNVTGKTGSWPDVSTDGEITYQVKFNEFNGTIRFSRTSGALTIETNILKEGSNLLPFIFNVSGVTQQ